MTFEALFDRVKQYCFPDKVGDRIAPRVRQDVCYALTDLQRLLPKTLQRKHTDIVPFRATYFDCGRSRLCAVKGDITKVYTVDQNWPCEKLYLDRWSFDDLRCWSRRFHKISGSPDNTGMPTLPLGLQFAEQTTDRTWGRATRAVFAVERGQIWIAPWLQSTEAVGIEWNGVKRTYNDSDEIDLDLMSEFEDIWFQVICDWVQAQRYRFSEKDLQLAGTFMESHADNVAKLMSEERVITEHIREHKTCAADSITVACAESAKLAAGDPVSADPAEDPTVFAIIGDEGKTGAGAEGVSALVNGWDPEVIITLGDNDYGEGLEDTVGQYYDKTIVRPALGNHDLDAGLPITDYFAFFTYLAKKERFYRFTVGLVDNFIIDSGINTAGDLIEPFGNGPLSPQGQWLQAALLQSLAKYKLVHWHHPPYSSSSTYSPGITQMRPLAAKLKSWGADALFSGHGHHYEHLLIDGFHYFVNGAGGGDLVAFTTPVDGSVTRYNADYGAIKVSAVCASCTVEFVNTSGEVIETVELTNDNPPEQSE